MAGFQNWAICQYFINKIFSINDQYNSPYYNLQVRMDKIQYRFNTPERSSFNRNDLKGELSTRRHNFSNQTNRYEDVIDYKAKAFEMMQTISELEIKENQSHRTIFYLQRELEIIHKNLDNFLSDLGQLSLADVKQKYRQLQEEANKLKKQAQTPLMKEEKITQEYEKILREYKQIITVQEQKNNKYLQKWKLRESSLCQEIEELNCEQKILREQLKQNKENWQKQKEALIEKYELQCEQLRSETIKLKKETQAKINQEEGKMKENSSRSIEQNLQIKQDLEMLKEEFREILIEKQNIEQKHEKLKRKYKQEIEHFETIEKEVQEKLIEVEKQITFYKEERELHLDQIKKLQQQNHLLSLNPHEIQEEFSFGGYFSVETQTQTFELHLNQGHLAMNAECYEISIKSLLEENTRLKKTLALLEKTKQGEKLPPEAELQLKLLKGITQITCPKSTHKTKQQYREESPTFCVLESEVGRSTATVNQFQPSSSN